jgi:hypothetical protein
MVMPAAGFPLSSEAERAKSCWEPMFTQATSGRSIVPAVSRSVRQWVVDRATCLLGCVSACVAAGLNLALVVGVPVRTEPARAGSVFWGGARCAAWPIVKAPPPQKKGVKKYRVLSS